MNPSFSPILRMPTGVVEYKETSGLLVTTHWCERNRRAPVLRSRLGLIPLEVFLAHPDDILVFQDKSNYSNHQLAPENPFDQVLDPPQIIRTHQRHREANDPANPRWKIPPSEWSRVLQRIEHGETLRQIAREYSASYEAVRRVVRAAQSQVGNMEACVRMRIFRICFPSEDNPPKHHGGSRWSP